MKIKCFSHCSGICLLLVILLLVSTSLNVYGDSVDSANTMQSKLSTELQNSILDLEADDKVKVAVWLKDADETVYDSAYTSNLQKSFNTGHMLIKSILMTSAERIPNMDSVMSTSTYFRPALSRSYGAGMIDAMEAYSLATDTNKWFYYSDEEAINSSDSYSVDITVSQNAINRSKKLAISFTWNKRVDNTSSGLVSYNGYCHAIELYDPSGNRVAYSVTAYDTKEFIYYQPTVAGTYQIKIIKLGSSNDGGAVGALSYNLYS